MPMDSGDDCQPSTCEDHDWLYAMNKTNVNNHNMPEPDKCGKWLIFEPDTNNTKDFWRDHRGTHKPWRDQPKVDMTFGDGGRQSLYWKTSRDIGVDDDDEEPFNNVDEVWADIKAATTEGRLGPASKVSTFRNTSGVGSSRAGGESVICVYTYDWTDERDVMRVRDELSNMGFTRKLSYKSNQDTRAGVYRATGHRRASKYYC